MSEPAGVLKFAIIQLYNLRFSFCGETEHQGRGKWPGLRAVIVNIANPYISFLNDLANHGVFEALAGFDKAGNRGVACFWPTLLSSEKASDMVAKVP